MVTLPLPAGIGITAIPNQYQRRAFECGTRYNILVVGPTGLGKTTFLQTLLGIPLSTLSTTIITPASSNSDSKNIANASNSIAGNLGIHIVEKYGVITESCFETTLCISEVAGFGEEHNSTTSQATAQELNWKPIVEYIDSKNEAYWKHVVSVDRTRQLSSESSSTRNESTDIDSTIEISKLHQSFDGRIHCCLYFLSPHAKGLKPLDIVAMKAIGEKCNLVPLIAKADTLSKSELATLKVIVKETIRSHNITTFDKVYSIFQQQQLALASNSFAVDEDADPTDEPSPKAVFSIANIDEEDGPMAQRTAEILSSFPLAVIGASEDSLNGIYAINGHEQLSMQATQYKITLARTYPWGQVDVENESYSDFKRIRSLLFRVNMDDLIFSTNSIHWEKFRKVKLQSCANIAMKKVSIPIPANISSNAHEEANKIIAEAKAEIDAYSQKEEKRLKEYEQSVRDLKERLEREIEKEHYEVREIQEKLIGFQHRRNPVIEVANC